MLVKVRKKEFKIELVNNYVDQLYSELVEKSYELQALGNDVLELAHKRAEDIKAGGNVDFINSEFNKNVHAMELQKKEISKVIIDNRLEIIKELLESNDIEYDQKWWMRRTNADDLNNFVIDCLKGNGNDKKNEKKK